MSPSWSRSEVINRSEFKKITWYDKQWTLRWKKKCIQNDEKNLVKNNWSWFLWCYKSHWFVMKVIYIFLCWRCTKCKCLFSLIVHVLLWYKVFCLHTSMLKYWMKYAVLMVPNVVYILVYTCKRYSECLHVGYGIYFSDETLISAKL